MSNPIPIVEGSEADLRANVAEAHKLLQAAVAANDPHGTVAATAALAMGLITLLSLSVDRLTQRVDALETECRTIDLRTSGLERY